MSSSRTLARVAATALLFAAVQARAQVVRVAPVPLTLGVPAVLAQSASLPFYAGLLARQNAGETLDLSAVPRPGLASCDGGRFMLTQGSGRYEKLHAGEHMELFVPEDQPLPSGSVVLERGVPGELAAAANLLSSRGKTGSNPVLVGIFTDGKTFVRVRAGREDIDAPLSKAAYEEEELSAALLERAGAARAKLARRLASPSFRAKSILERRSALLKMLDAAGR
ncbi:MAG: hypothetical protein WC969_04615 [Elusimicrobiota bacterium]|jgi:hypothetical protein